MAGLAAKTRQEYAGARMMSPAKNCRPSIVSVAAPRGCEARRTGGAQGLWRRGSAAVPAAVPADLCRRPGARDARAARGWAAARLGGLPRAQTWGWMAAPLGL